jgi:hypothetical protein
MKLESICGLRAANGRPYGVSKKSARLREKGSGIKDQGSGEVFSISGDMENEKNQTGQRSFDSKSSFKWQFERHIP